MVTSLESWDQGHHHETEEQEHKGWPVLCFQVFIGRVFQEGFWASLWHGFPSPICSFLLSSPFCLCHSHAHGWGGDWMSHRTVSLSNLVSPQSRMQRLRCLLNLGCLQSATCYFRVSTLAPRPLQCFLFHHCLLPEAYCLPVLSVPFLSASTREDSLSYTV